MTGWGREGEAGGDWEGWGDLGSLVLQSFPVEVYTVLSFKTNKSQFSQIAETGM